MVCSKCGTALTGSFCPNCGTRMDGDRSLVGWDNLTPLLIDRTERIQAVVGNNMAQRFLTTGVLGNGFAVLTDKRVYFKGKCIFFRGKGIYSKTEENTVDLKDVSGTGFVHNKAVWAKVGMLFFSFPAGLMLLSMFLNGALLGHDVGMLVPGVAALGGAALIFWFLYRMYNYSVFRISYAGGSIAFDTHWTTQQETKLFQQQLVLLKQAQQYAEKNTERVDVKPDPADHVPELLVKYKALMDQGVITPEDFEEKKKQLLGM